MTTGAELDELRGRTRPGAIGERYDRRPADGPPPAANLGGIHFAKTVALYNSDDSVYEGWATEEIWVSYVTAHPCDETGGNVDVDRTLNIRTCQETAPGTSPTGHTEASLGYDTIIQYVSAPHDDAVDGYLQPAKNRPFLEVVIA